MHKDEINKEVQDRLAKDIIRLFDSLYSSFLWIVSKRSNSMGNKRWRMIID